MASHEIIINGHSLSARRGELLLDAALNVGVDLPYNCRAGHCGTCCVRLLSGKVHGGASSEHDIVHACQCQIVGDAVFEKLEPQIVRTVDGTVSSLRSLSRDVLEVGISTDAALPFHAGQYAQVDFQGFPSRPFSMTHALTDNADSRSVWFHIRRMEGGHVTAALGSRITTGHRVSLSGPFGAAHFRANQKGRQVLVATSTGFAPIWSIAAAALRENPYRRMMIIAGARKIESLYMGPALMQLSRFPNVLIVPVCSTPQTVAPAVMLGRPTDYLPRLLPTDVLYACGAPDMVQSIKSIAAQVGAQCYADPFLPTTSPFIKDTALTRAIGWLAVPASRQGPHIRSPQSRNKAQPKSPALATLRTGGSSHSLG